MQAFSLLAQCARVRCTAANYQRLAEEARRFTKWATLPTHAEANGLGPLAYTHLRSAGVELPRDTAGELRALTLRHRHANQVRSQVLAEILAALEGAGIRALVLKGAALCHVLYPRPGMRPMRDLDLLVDPSALHAARKLVAQLEGHRPEPQVGADAHEDRHLVAALTRDHLLVSVEIHHVLPGVGTDAPVPFALGPDGAIGHAPSHEEMLGHICAHMIEHVSVFAPMRLIWVADAVGYAERFVDEIDWARLRQRFPMALSVLSLLHSVSPASEELISRAGLRIGPVPRGVGVDFHGWPRTSLAAQRQKGTAAILRDTLFPSQWWLRLRYGLDSARPLFWYRWVRHPLNIVAKVGHLVRGRIRGRMRRSRP
jgi:hypothetical protein